VDNPNAERRGSLEALRDTLAMTILDATPATLPGLAREFRAVLKELADLPVAVEADPLHDIARQREKRLADTDVFDEAV
jgi:hypothetical protein